MIIKQITDDELFEYCSNIIWNLPDFKSNSTNSISSKNFFIPIQHAHKKNQLRSHLENLERGLADEKNLCSSIGQDIISEYSKKTYESLKLNLIISIGNYARLILIKLASEKVITLSSEFKPSINSQSAYRTVLLYPQVYSSAVIHALTLTTAARTDTNKNLLPVTVLKFLDDNPIPYKTRSGAFFNLARACLCQGVSSLAEFKYEDWANFYSDYISVPERAAISISALSVFLGECTHDNELKHKLENPGSFVKSVFRESEFDVFSGSRSEAIGLLGDVKYIKSGILYNTAETVKTYRAQKNNVVSYHNYWDNSEVESADFSPQKLTQKNSSIWKVAQAGFLDSKQEHGTKKANANSLSYLNMYLFSYLPAYFDFNKPVGVNFPHRPKDFISAIFIQRSPIFEFESGFGGDFIFPVMLEDFVQDVSSSRSKIHTKNNNSAKSIMRNISLFFDYLIAITVGNPESDFFLICNPLQLSYSKIKGTKYLKSRKQPLTINYWSGFRVFIKLISKKMLKDNLALISSKSSVYKDLSNYPINSSFEMNGKKVEIGHVDLRSIGVYRILLPNNRALRIPNVNILVMLNVMNYSGQRLSNVLWLDANTFCSLDSENKRLELLDGFDNELVPILINTDKALNTEFEIHIPLFVYRDLLNVKALLEKNKYDWSHTPIYYRGEKNSKWPKITPLFRTVDSHLDPTIPMASLLQQYELCLAESSISTSDSQFFYMPAKFLEPAEHIYNCEQDKHEIKELTAYVKYFGDNENEVPFLPVKVGSLITPHSLRLMINSVYSPALGEEIVSKLMTGQTEATVGYYTVDLDETSSDLISHIASMMNLSGKQIVSKAPIDEDDFKKRFNEGTAEQAYQIKTINFATDAILDDQSLPPTGLSALRMASASALAFNRTHICPFNNKCPRTVILELGEQECSGCPFTITTSNHIPAIATELKAESEMLKTMLVQLENKELSQLDIDKLQRRYSKLLKEATNWYIRLKVITNNPSGLFIMSPEGKKALGNDTPITSDSSPLQAFLRRLQEVRGDDLLKTESLKIQSSRFMRLAEINLTKVNWDAIPEIDEIDAAYNYFKTICDCSSLDVKETLNMLEDKFTNQNVALAIGVK